MLMIIIGDLSVLGAKYHSRKSNKFCNTDKKYAYHVYMMSFYTAILKLILDSDVLREKYLD